MTPPILPHEGFTAILGMLDEAQRDVSEARARLAQARATVRALMRSGVLTHEQSAEVEARLPKSKVATKG